MPERIGGEDRRDASVGKLDLCRYVAGTADLETCRRIAEQRKIIGSPVQLWLEEFDGKVDAMLDRNEQGD